MSPRGTGAQAVLAVFHRSRDRSPGCGIGECVSERGVPPPCRSEVEVAGPGGGGSLPELKHGTFVVVVAVVVVSWVLAAAAVVVV